MSRLERESNPAIPGKPGYLPQHETATPGEYQPTGVRNPLPSKLYAEDENGNKIPVKVGGNGELLTQLTGSNLQEQLTEADAVSGTLTFADTISVIEILNQDINDGVFTVNGIAITIPAGGVFKDGIGGTPSTEVTVTGSTDYLVGRYE